MIIKDGKLRTGTAPPYGWVDNTFKNRFVQKYSNVWNYDKSWVKILYRMFIGFPIGCFRERVLRRNYWRIRCLLGIHQKDAFLQTLSGSVLPYCFWCSKQIGEAVEK